LQRLISNAGVEQGKKASDASANGDAYTKRADYRGEGAPRIELKLKSGGKKKLGLV